MKRRVLLAVLALLLFGVGYVAWTLAGLPPVKYYLCYGLDPYCEPTGAKETYEGVEFIEIGPGIFRMGSTFLAEGGDWLGKICAPLGLPWGEHPEPSKEMPVHWVEFRHGFWIARTELTNAQYERFRGGYERSLYSKGDDTPAVEVSWEDARAYCGWMSERSGRRIRLPSEAEWECASRAGSRDEFPCGDTDPGSRACGCFLEEFSDDAPTVRAKPPNRWGLFGFHCSVWEWCEDRWHNDYEGAPSDGSPWTETDLELPDCVIRGGCRGSDPEECRSAHRHWDQPWSRYHAIGFRPAITSPGD